MPKIERKKHIWEAIDGPGVKVDKFSPDNEDAVRMMENLASQEKVRTRIPRDAKEPVDSFHTVILDSVRINILKGVSVNLPEQVADVIEDAFYKTDQALAPTGVNPFSGKTVNMRMDLKTDADMINDAN